MPTLNQRGEAPGGDWWSQNAPSGGSFGAGTPGSYQQPGGPQALTNDAALSGTPTVTGGTPAPSGSGGYSFPIPPGFDPSNPTDKLVLDNFEKYKSRAAAGDQGAMPTAENMNYWRKQINDNGGVGDASKAQYWNEKMTPGAGGGGGGGGAGAWGGAGAAPPAPFVAPTGLDYTNDPGFKERMKMGTDAIQGAAAAKGSLLSGGTLKALERYGQDYGSNEFGNVYNRAAGTYGLNVATQRNAQNDYWSRLNDLYQTGYGAVKSGYQPPG